MSDKRDDIDWSLTTWEGSRRAQLRHAGDAREGRVHDRSSRSRRAAGGKRSGGSRAGPPL